MIDLTRRAVAFSLAGSASLMVARGSTPLVVSGGEWTPESFGARGDGVADDYEALLRLASAVSGRTGAVVRFGYRKRYFINRVQPAYGPRQKDVPSIEFLGCEDLTVDLNESVIDVKGDFHRGADVRTAKYALSSVRAVQPLSFLHCSGLVIRNGEMTGNCNRMTLDPGVAESGGRGIALRACSNVQIEDMHIHHFSSDGIGILPDEQRRACRGVWLRRLRLMNNARQGLTNAGGSGVFAEDCLFSESGHTDGSYFHAPCAGVDLEPNFELDVRSDFHARRCRFDGNRGSPLVAGDADKEAAVELIDCSASSPSQRRLLLACETAVVRGGVWRNIQIGCAYGVRRRPRRIISIEVSNGLWTGDDPNWVPVFDLSELHPFVYIHDNRFELRPQGPSREKFLFKSANPNERFENNDIFVSAAAYAGPGDQPIGNFRGAQVRSNRWSTDLQGRDRFVNDYRGARKMAPDRFFGSFGHLN